MFGSLAIPRHGTGGRPLEASRSCRATRREATGLWPGRCAGTAWDCQGGRPDGAAEGDPPLPMGDEAKRRPLYQAFLIGPRGKRRALQGSLQRGSARPGRRSAEYSRRYEAVLNDALSWIADDAHYLAALVGLRTALVGGGRHYFIGANDRHPTVGYGRLLLEERGAGIGGERFAFVCSRSTSTRRVAHLVVCERARPYSMSIRSM
jgi:hypothetical protein